MNSNANTLQGTSQAAHPARGDSRRSPAPPLNIGVCGLGTVGTELVRLLSGETTRLARSAGRALNLCRIASRTPKPELTPDSVRFDTDLFALVEDPRVDVLVELIGGVEPAKSLIERALELGKPVVTANKEVLARHGDALLAYAAQAGVPIGFEASVGGGIPVIKALRESFAGDRIQRIVGMVNGTTNFILSRMGEKGASFAAALAEAQALGYAEAQPDYDVQGTDAAHKMAIIAAIVWGQPFDVGCVRAEGMEHISSDDLHFAARLGYSIKHLGLAEMHTTGLEVRVYPALVHESNLLSRVDGVTNALEVTSQSLGKSLLIGPGAGGAPTANAVLADILDIASGRAVAPLPGAARPARADLMSESTASFYLRAEVDDKTGVLAQLTDVLASEGIGIDAILQPEAGQRESADGASIVLVTHAVDEARMRGALRLIASRSAIRAPLSLIPIYA